MAYGYAHHNVKKCPGVFFKGGCDGRGRPVPGHVYCAKCERAMEERSKAKDASAHDADRRARLHRALDCVLDRKMAKDALPERPKYDPSGWCPKTELVPDKVAALKARKQRLSQLPTDEIASMYKRLSRVDVGRQPKADMISALIRSNTEKRDLYFGGWQI